MEDMDILGEEIVMQENINTLRFIKFLDLSLFYGLRAGASYMFATGLWYFAVSVNGLAQYSTIAETGKNLVFISVFVILYLTGEPDV